MDSVICDQEALQDEWAISVSWYMELITWLGCMESDVHAEPLEIDARSFSASIMTSESRFPILKLIMVFKLCSGCP